MNINLKKNLVNFKILYKKINYLATLSLYLLIDSLKNYLQLARKLNFDTTYYKYRLPWFKFVKLERKINFYTTYAVYYKYSEIKIEIHNSFSTARRTKKKEEIVTRL